MYLVHSWNRLVKPGHTESLTGEGWLYLLPDFMISSLSLLLSSLTMICLGIDPFLFVLFRVCCTFLGFLETLWHYLFKYYFCFIFSFFPLELLSHLLCVWLSFLDLFVILSLFSLVHMFSSDVLFQELCLLSCSSSNLFLNSSFMFHLAICNLWDLNFMFNLC